jgi:hypothetical protein
MADPAFALLEQEPVQKPGRVAAPPAVPVETLGGAAAPLETLRAAGRRARSEPRLTLAEAQRTLSRAEEIAPADALVRVLGEILGRRPVIHCPGCKLASFDEAWLCRCHAAQAAGDGDSLALLVGARVPCGVRRSFLDLLRAV